MNTTVIALCVLLFIALVVIVVMYVKNGKVNKNFDELSDTYARLASDKVKLEERNLSLAKDTNQAKADFRKLQESAFATNAEWQRKLNDQGVLNLQLRNEKIRLERELQQVKESHRTDHEIVSKVKFTRGANGRFCKITPEV